MIIFLHPLGKDDIHPIEMRHVEQLSQAIGEEIEVVETLQHRKEEVEIAFGYAPYLTLDNLQQLPNLKWLHSMTSGVDLIPYEYLLQKNIMFTNSKGLHGQQISEHIIGTMISFTRGLVHHYKNQSKRIWDTSYPYQQLLDKTLCIVGTGNIGKELARKAKAFDMRVIGVKKHPETLEHFDRIVSNDQMKSVFRESDFVVVLVPLTPETKEMIGYSEFDAMRNSAIFMNFSRGGVVNETALIEALRQNKIQGAGLDVFQTEPLPESSPLWTLPNVIISPHIAGTTRHQEQRELELFKKLYHHYKKENTLFNRVDLLNRY